jgi:hypothetical protein
LKDPPKSELSRFELGVLAAVVLAANLRWMDSVHWRARKATGRRLQAQVDDMHVAELDGRLPFTPAVHEEARRRVPAAFRRRGGSKQARVKAWLQVVGEDIYPRERKRVLAKGPPEHITVERSRRALLTSVGVQVDGHHLARLPDVLDRLCDPIGKYPLPAPLAEWQPLRSGRLRLTVNGAWLQRPYRQVGLPLPMRLLTPLWLYLFLRGIRTDAINEFSIDFARLCQRVGITTRRGAKAAWDQLETTLNAVNDHLAGLSNESIKAHRAEHYELIYLDGRIRFQAVTLRAPDEDIEVVEIPMGLRPKARRQLRAQVEQAEQAEKAMMSVSPIPRGWKRRFAKVTAGWSGLGTDLERKW